MELVLLGFVHFALLEDLDGFLFDGGFPGPVAHAGEALLVGRQFTGEFGEFDVDGLYSRVDLERWSVGGRTNVRVVSLAFAMALFRVGFGAVFFAPNNRFILATRVLELDGSWNEKVCSSRCVRGSL